VNKLYFTIGLPRSGKSTFARRWQRGEVEVRDGKFTDDPLSEDVSRINNVPRIVVTPDAFRLALGHRYNWYVEPVVFSHVQVAIRAFLQDYDVLVDDTHTSEESIKRILEIDPSAINIMIDTPLETCCERAILSGQKDLIPVIQRMNSNLGKLWLSYQLPGLKSLRLDVANHSSRKIIV
jgi:hypothetical protein